MNERTRRIHRLAGVVEQQEQRSRRALGVAIQERDDAAHALQSAFLQCRDVVQRPDEFSVRFGRGLIEAGWLAERERRAALVAAVDAADRRLDEWHHQRTRVDALERLKERLQQAETEEVERHAEGELGDLISARTVVGSVALGGEGRR